MADELISREAVLKKLSRMIDYCKTDNKVTGLTALFQVADAIMDCPSVDAVVLPCKVGDTIYKIPSKTNYALNIISGKPEINRVYKQKICRIELYENGVYMPVTCDGIDAVHSAFFGVDWFLTKEEAEAALEGRENDG